MYSLGQPITRVTKQVLALPGKDPAATKSMVQSSPEFHKYRDQLVHYTNSAEQEYLKEYAKAYSEQGVEFDAAARQEALQAAKKDLIDPAWQYYNVAIEEAAYKVSQMQQQGLGDDDIEEFLSGFKIKKFIKKITKPIVKVVKPVAKFVGKIHAPLIGAMTLGLIKPKALGFKSTQAQKLYKIGGTVGKIGAAVAVGVIAGPAIASAVGKGGSVLLGGLKWAGGKLISAPAGLLNKVKQGFIDKGESVEDAGQHAQQALQNMSPEEVYNLAQGMGLITPNMAGQIIDQSQAAGFSRPEDFRQSAIDAGYMEPTGEEGGPIMESGMIAGLTPQTLVIGAGLLAIILFSGSPQNRRR